MGEKIHANKKLGQHFLTSRKVIEAITNDFADMYKTIIEVGPGAAALTHDLAKKNFPLHIIEKDIRFKKLYNTLLDEDKILFTDALSMNLDNYLDERNLEQPIWLASNLPYNISTPLFLKFLKTERIEMLTLMFQKEVADKILPIEGKKNQTASLNIISQNYFEVSRCIDAPPNAFSPPPKVESMVLSFKRIKKPRVPLNEFKNFESFLRLIFSSKRKQMGSLLKNRYSKEEINAAYKTLDLTGKERAEALSKLKIVELFEFFSGINND